MNKIVDQLSALLSIAKALNKLGISVLDVVKEIFEINGEMLPQELTIASKNCANFEQIIIVIEDYIKKFKEIYNKNTEETKKNNQEN
ncbi:MAG: hypothetical protein LBI28_03550 [Treponema sp.]|jgi:hypothetical protein|nr:hypothetical protein [Treponema sp.]